MLCLQGCVSCLEHAKRHCLLLNQDFLLNSLQQLSCACLKPPGRYQGLFPTEQLHPPCCKCLDTVDETAWAGKGSPAGLKMVEQSHKRNPRYRPSVGKEPEMDLINSSSAPRYETQSPGRCVGTRHRGQSSCGRCVPSLLHSPRSPARSSSGVAL